MTATQGARIMADQALVELAERCEGGPPELQGALLEEAWEACAAASAEFRAFAVAHVSGFDNNAGRFGAALEARAYETAAFMLVPEGWDGAIYLPTGTLRPVVQLETPAMRERWSMDEECAAGSAATIALALCAAALRARAHAEGLRTPDGVEP